MLRFILDSDKIIWNMFVLNKLHYTWLCAFTKSVLLIDVSVHIYWVTYYILRQIHASNLRLYAMLMNNIKQSHVTCLPFFMVSGSYTPLVPMEAISTGSDNYTAPQMKYFQNVVSICRRLRQLMKKGTLQLALLYYSIQVLQKS